MYILVNQGVGVGVTLEYPNMTSGAISGVFSGTGVLLGVGVGLEGSKTVQGVMVGVRL